MPRINYEWVCHSPKETFVRRLHREEVVDHPLANQPRPEPKASSGKQTSVVSMFLDPLSASLDGDDPLSAMAAERDRDGTDSSEKEYASTFGCKPWSEERVKILAKFTTSQKLSVASSFLHSGDRGGSKSVLSGSRTRLEQWDDMDDGPKEYGQLTQEEYVDRINQLNKELVDAWHQDFRVNALKITIQCSKLLVDTSVIHFYPSKFVLITDTLDVFGKLVYERLFSKAEYIPPGKTKPTLLPRTFTADMVPESAKETCRNWFYKIASIRELVPRFYVEAAVLKSYSFLTSKGFSQALLRLTKMIRGIGDPLVAIYSRFYLCRVAMSVSTIDLQMLTANFFDFLDVYDQIFSSRVQAGLNKQKVDMESYLNIYSPAVEWILHALSQNASQEIINQIVEKCADKKNKGLLINSILRSFKAPYVIDRAEYFLKVIETCHDDGFPQYRLLKTLGECLQGYNVADPSRVLNLAWKQIISYTNPAHYMICAHSWAPYIVKNFSVKEVNMFLGDTIRHMGNDGKQFNNELQGIILTIINYAQDFEALFTMDKLLPTLDLFSDETLKVSICRKILEAYNSRQDLNATTDPVTTDSLMFLGKIIHDSVNALTVEDEKRQIGLLIAQLIKRINFGWDFEKQLSFYVEARGTFLNIDFINSTLVQCVNRLAMETGRVVKGHHTQKTSSFVRACAAYCYITVPSIKCEITRLQLYLLSAQVALFNQCLGQADACIKAALSLLPELPTSVEVDGKVKKTENFLLEYAASMLSTLLVLPDSPNQGVLFLTKGLVNMLQHYIAENEQSTETCKKSYLYVLDMLAASAQTEYPYHVKKVDSNDALYGSDPKFIAEINKMCTVLVDEILNYLQILGSKEQYQSQASIAHDLFLRVVWHADLNQPGIVDLASSLWTLAHKGNYFNAGLSARTVEYLEARVLECPPKHGLHEIVRRVKIISYGQN